MALANLFYKVGLQQGVLPKLWGGSRSAFSSIATALAGDAGAGLQADRPWPGPFGAGGAPALRCWLALLLHGLARGFRPSVLVPVAQMSFVFTALFGAVMFREHLNNRKRLWPRGRESRRWLCSP